jgi:plasmid maintenance system killer protein
MRHTVMDILYYIHEFFLITELLINKITKMLSKTFRLIHHSLHKHDLYTMYHYNFYEAEYILSDSIFEIRVKGQFPLAFISQWGRTTGNAATVAHSTKKKTSGKDSVIEGQPLLLFM